MMLRAVVLGILCALGKNLYALSEGDIKDRIEASAKHYLKENNGAGLAIAVIKNSFTMEKPYQKVFCLGYSRRVHKNSVKESTLFRLGSLSKTFVATLFAALLEEGKVTLEEKAEKYLPKTFALPQYHEHSFTLMELLLNISSLPNMPTMPMRDYKTSWVDVESYFRKYKLKKPPGHHYENSDLGYALLGHIATRIERMSYEKILQEKILQPLKLEESYYTLPLAKTSLLATGYRTIVPIGDDLLDREGSFFKPCRGMVSSIQDMKKWLAFFLKLEKSPLEGCLKHLYHTSYTSLDGMHKEIPGWHIAPLSHKKSLMVYYEDGVYQGFSHAMAFIPDTRTGVVILSNAEYSVHTLAFTILEMLHE